MKPWCSVLLGLLIGSTTSFPVKAQIVSDGTTNSFLTLTSNGISIDGGDQAGGNLFHSFGEFSVPTGAEAFFNNASDVNNIFSRVTGGNISIIDGLVRSNSSANLFIINPVGMLFGENASLDIGGSFYSSTADSILFPSNIEFAASNPVSPLLTINEPIGLRFRDNPGAIVNRSVNSFQVRATETFSLVGGNISVESGNILGENGRISLGSVAGNNIVNLTASEAQLLLDFAGVNDFQDISFVNSSIIMEGDNGEIQIVGRNVEFQDSQILANPGSTVSIQAEQIIINNTTSSIPEPSGKVGLLVLIGIKAVSAIIFRKETIPK